jgi:hypothetical protein
VTVLGVIAVFWFIGALVVAGISGYCSATVGEAVGKEHVDWTFRAAIFWPLLVVFAFVFIATNKDQARKLYPDWRQ